MSTVLTYGWIIFYSLSVMNSRFGLRFDKMARLLVKNIICLALMALVSWLLSRLGLGSVDKGRMICLLTLLVNGLISAIVYLAAALFLHVPQSLFHFKLKRNAGKKAA